MEKMYALDWNHDCFEFSPMEDISMNYNYYDPDRQCQVYFPTYYPDGDYYFFIDSTWDCGIFGHPWRNEIIVTGKELIKRFEKNKGRLRLLRYFLTVAKEQSFTKAAEQLHITQPKKSL